jgi:hypothetical protein
MADPTSEPTVVPISPAVAGLMGEDVPQADVAPSAREQNLTTDHNADSKTSRDVLGNATSLPFQPGAEPQEGQQPLRLRDIRVGNTDGRGLPITYITLRNRTNTASTKLAK